MDDRDQSGDELLSAADDEHTAAVGAARRRALPPLARGDLLADRYQIEETLGEGGSGIVYRAWDRLLGELIAIKVLRPERAEERSWIRRLTREVRVARAIRHPNVCRVFELGHAEGYWFVTMELARGGSLRDRLGSTVPVVTVPTVAGPVVGGPAAGGGPKGESRPGMDDGGRGDDVGGTDRPVPGMSALRPLATRIADIRQLCAGLGAIHAVGITHRDVTPRNVLVMTDGRLVLTDFGLAIERDDQTTVLGGTPAYMPPEAASGGRSDQRSDVFQLGMIMHEILTGRRPVWTSDGTRLDVAEPDPGTSAVEQELARLVTECVERDPARRPPTALAVAGRLAAAEAARELAWPLRMAARVRRFARRHPRLPRALAGLLVLGVVARVAQVVSRPPLCQGGAAQMAGVWDEARAEAVRRAFAATQQSFATDAFGRVKPLLDAFAQGWVNMYQDACEATHRRGEQSAEVLDLRMECLKARASDLRALGDLLAQADGAVVARSINAASGLQPVTTCADVTALRAVVPPPNDEVRTKVEALRPRLSDARALRAAGRFFEGTELVSQLVVDARAQSYLPFLVEVLQVAGEIEMWTRPTDEVAALFDEALVGAEAARHDRALAEIAVDEAGFFSVFDRFEALDRLVPRARATIARIGGNPRLESWLDTAIAYGAKTRKRYAEALAFDEKALALKRRVLGNDHWDVALTLGNVADELHLLGRNEEALERNGAVIAVLERALGPRHPDVGLHLCNRGDIHRALGQPQLALEDYQRALDIWKGALAPEQKKNWSYALTGIGLAHLQQAGAGGGERSGDASQAIAPLERALALRTAGNLGPAMRAETAFGLARALWLTGRDRPRAERLAEEARALLGDEASGERREIEATLAAWRVRAPRSPRTSAPRPRD
jgi:tetratricopeptide (TPR) repeat protein